jgi:hypothetical protein
VECWRRGSQPCQQRCPAMSSTSRMADPRGQWAPSFLRRRMRRHYASIPPLASGRLVYGSRSAPLCKLRLPLERSCGSRRHRRSDRSRDDVGLLPAFAKCQMHGVCGFSLSQESALVVCSLSQESG